MIRNASANAKEMGINNVKFIQGDVASFATNEKFDFIFSRGANQSTYLGKTGRSAWFIEMP